MLIKDLRNGVENGVRSTNVPKELVEYFNKKLPGGLEYKPFGEHQLAVDYKQMKGNFVFFKDKNKEWWNKYGKYIKNTYDLLEIMDITQTPLKVDQSEIIEVDGIEIPYELLFKDITNNNAKKLVQTYIYPKGFEEHKIVVSAQKNDKKLSTAIKQRKSENIENISFDNYETESPLRISISIHSKYYTGNDKMGIGVSFSIDNKKAKSIFDLFIAQSLLKAFLEDDFKINNEIIHCNITDKDRKDKMINTLDNNLRILYMLLRIEEQFNVCFDPSYDITNEDIELISMIYSSFILNSVYKTNEAIDTLTLPDKSETNDVDKSVIGKNMAYLSSSSFDFNFLGVELHLYGISAYYFVVIKSIDSIDSKRYKISFDCSNENYYSGIKLFRTEKEMKAVIEKQSFNDKKEEYQDVNAVIASITPSMIDEIK